MRVLVTDGNERAALAVTRALGREGLEVIVGAETERSLAGSSKFCWSSFAYPSPYTEARAAITRVGEVVQNLNVDVIFPISDLVMSLSGRHRREFPAHAKLPIPELESFETLSSKYRLMQLAAELGIPIPRTVFVPDGRLENVGRCIREFPVVVKPGQSVVEIDGHFKKTAVRYAADENQLRRLYATVDDLRQPSLIQSRVDGEGQGIFALMNQGNPVALFAHRRLREKPPAGGVSVFRESIALPEQMTEYALRLLQGVNWHGVAMVEFKVDRQTGTPLLMEVNGRFWGSLQLAIDAGMNFPFMLFQMAVGEAPLPPAEGYLAGVKSRWLLGDLDHLMLRLFKPDDGLPLPKGSPGKLRTIAGFCRFFQTDMRYEVLRMEDPKPFFHELRQYAGALLGRTPGS